MSKQEEMCFICDQPTGRAGIHDDSLYAEDGTGPYCEECWDAESLEAARMEVSDERV